MLKVQEYFHLIQTILACIVVCFSCLCWGISAARSQTCQGNMSQLTEAAKHENGVGNGNSPADKAENMGGVRGPRPEMPLRVHDSTQQLSKHHVKFRKAYNRGFFRENERYILQDTSLGGLSFGFRPARIKSFDKDGLVIEEVDTDGNITERRIQAYEVAFKDISVHPRAMHFFQSLDSQLAEVGSVRYPQFNNEVQMAQQGFTEEMSQGLDIAYKMNHLANHLRGLKINPYKTHIADFSDQIPEHIRFIREGLQGHNKAAEGLELLDELALEASKKQKEKGVTYAWWLNWIEKLNGVYNKDEYRSGIDIDFLIQVFPDFVALPSFGSLGAMAINKLTSENIFPLGLVNKPTFADNQKFKPFRFFVHDYTHARAILRSQTGNSNFPYGRSSSMTAKEVYEKTQDLPANQQQQAEFVYFYITHERGELYDVVPDSDDFLEEIYQIIQKDKSLFQLLPEHIRKNEQLIPSYIREADSVYRNLLME